MKIETVCVLGGTGFVGQHLINRLFEEGKRIRVLTRHRERHRELLVLPNVEVVEANVHDPTALRAQFEGMDAVINLVGILNPAGRRTGGFKKAHVELAEKVIQACKEADVKRLLHMSALHADSEKAPSEYLRSKGVAEDRVFENAGEVAVTSFRPSVIFGPGDSFFNRFAGLLKRLPCSFPLVRPRARFAPVFVGDVVNVFADALEDEATFGQRIALCGPKTYTLRELVEYTRDLTGQRNIIIGLPDWLATIQATFMEFVPGKPLTRDNLKSMKVDSVCPEGSVAQPTTIEAVVPFYVGQKNLRAKYNRFRKKAGRKGQA